MKPIAAIAPALLALGLLTGCARGLDARVSKLEADNAELKQQVASLNAGVRRLLERSVRGPEFAPGPGWGPRAEPWAGPPPERRPGPPGGPPAPPGREHRGGPPPRPWF